MSIPKVSIIILNWNGWQDTLECLDSLAKITYPNYDVVIIDNGSVNKSAKKIKNWINTHKSVISYKLLVNSRNAGFAGGNNVGIKYALANNANYVLLLNNDTLVAPDFLNKLIKAGDSDKNIGIIGPKIYFASEKNKIWFGGGYFSWFGGGKHLEYEKIDKKPSNDKIKEVDYMTGCCFLIKRETIEKIGLMNENFFLYYEDTEWSLRARKNGYKIIYEPNSHIWHKVSRSVMPKSNPAVYYYHIRNALLLSKLRAPKIILAGICAWSAACCLKQIFKIIFLPQKREISKNIIKGIKDFYAGKFGIYEK